MILFIIFIPTLLPFIFSMYLLYQMCEHIYSSFKISSLCFFLAIVSWMCIPVFGIIAQHIAQLLTS